MIVANSPLPLLQIVLQVAVTSPHLHDPLNGFRTEGSAAEVGVENDARGIDYPTEAVLMEAVDGTLHLIGHLIDRGHFKTPPLPLALHDLLSQVGHCGTADVLYDILRSLPYTPSLSNSTSNSSIFGKLASNACLRSSIGGLKALIMSHVCESAGAERHPQASLRR